MPLPERCVNPFSAERPQLESLHLGGKGFVPVDRLSRVTDRLEALEKQLAQVLERLEKPHQWAEVPGLGHGRLL